MKLTQLRYALEIVRHRNHLSEAAAALHTSQPGVSRQIQLLEAELGFQIFRRTRNRIIGLTDQGREVLDIAERVVSDVNALHSLKDEERVGGQPTLTIGTTHVQAQYTLPRAIKMFAAQHPTVGINLMQGNPEEICMMVDSGEVDMAVGTDVVKVFPNVVHLPCLSLPRSVVAPKGHPLLKLKELTLEDLVAYPIITYDPRYSGRWRVMNAFKQANLVPTIALCAMDADVCKTYVELGLGVGIVTTITYDPVRDAKLGIRDAGHLFGPSTISVSLRSDRYLRKIALDFIQMLAPGLTPGYVRGALRVAARK
jgi:LysR family transcriptional regulator, cys regulon transcriptional activator